MSRRQAATGLAAGLALIAAAPLVWWITQPAPAGQTVTTVNAAAANELGSSSPMSSGAPGVASPGSSAEQDPASPSGAGSSWLVATTSDAPVVEPAPPTTTAQPAPAPAPATAPAANPAAAPAPAPPVRIELPSLGVDTDVIPVGVDDSGAMEVPDDVSEVGWYKFGPAPGAAAGSAVLTGHVDDYRQGVGVFGRIGDLTPGDVVRVSDQAGVSREFSVVSREEWAKGEVPLDRLFDRGGASRMVLITCGGSFNDSTLGYDDNIAITAVPIAS